MDVPKKEKPHNLNTLDIPLPTDTDDAPQPEPDLDMSSFAALDEEDESGGLGNPSVTFVFPYRWITDDRTYFAHNVYWQMARQLGKPVMKRLRRVLAYDCMIAYQYKQPLTDIPLDKKTLEELLYPIFPNGRCISLTFDYIQARGQPEMLPLMDMRLYFDVP